MEGSSKTVVLGAGPAGLAAADVLARAGAAPIVYERGKVAGGLMRSIRRGDYCVDLGRKELYSRLADVHELWAELLGDDYIEYPHRIGVLWQGAIIERSRRWAGFRRNIPWPIVVRGALDYVATQVTSPFRPPPRTEEEYWYRLRGRVFSRVLSKGFHEKFSGHSWADNPPPDGAERRRELLRRAFTSVFRRATVRDHGNAVWRHPALGSGQIVDVLQRDIEKHGGQFRFEAGITELVVREGRVVALKGSVGGSALEIQPEHVVAAVPIDILARLLGREPPADLKARDTRKRSTVIVYLFLAHPPRFQHAWLDVTDPSLRAGRITNYAGFGGRMVPAGFTCLAVEYFLVGEDPLLSTPDEDVYRLALDECARSGLVDASKCHDHLVLKFPGAFAADDYRSWQAPGVRAFLRDIEQISNLWYVNRAGTDVAMQAGIDAGRAIVDSDRARFLRIADPTSPLGIESSRLWS